MKKFCTAIGTVICTLIGITISVTAFLMLSRKKKEEDEIE